MPPEHNLPPVVSPLPPPKSTSDRSTVVLLGTAVCLLIASGVVLASPKYRSFVSQIFFSQTTQNSSTHTASSTSLIYQTTQAATSTVVTLVADTPVAVSGPVPFNVVFKSDYIVPKTARGADIDAGDGHYSGGYMFCNIGVISNGVLKNIGSCDGNVSVPYTYYKPGTYVAKLELLKSTPDPTNPNWAPVISIDKTIATATITVTQGLSCTSDSQCPSNYSCNAVQTSASTCTLDTSGNSVCTPNVITEGYCASKEGHQCNDDSDCAQGLLCSSNVCTNPVGKKCSGANDTSCPSDFSCQADCGPPVVQPDQYYTASYHCTLQGYRVQCPACLSKGTLINTPQGAVPVEDLKVGQEVWTTTKDGVRVVGKILEVSHTPVPTTHRVVHVVLTDGRELYASPGHPTVDGRTIGDLSVGDKLDGSRVISAILVPYRYQYTYDLLPTGDTGSYWANGILIGSTLFEQ